MDTQLAPGAGRPAPGAVRALPPRRARRAWRVPLGLILLSVVPVGAGAARLAQLSGALDITGTNARHLSSAVPLVLHIVTGTAFSLLGALQFIPSLRRRGHAWHRVTGRLLMPLGLTAALTALWITWLSSPSTVAGVLLYAERMLFGSLMVASLVLGFVAIRRRQVHRHRAWITRGYAIGMGAGTQVFTIGFGQAAFGKTALSHAVLSGAGWVINLAVAEWSVRRGARSFARAKGRILHQTTRQL